MTEQPFPGEPGPEQGARGNPGTPKPAGYRNPHPYAAYEKRTGRAVEDKVLDDGTSILMQPHQDGDEYIVRRYPVPQPREQQGRFGSGWEAAEYLRQQEVATSWEILHIRNGGATEVARYWPMTVIDCAG
jgi:hypothetical protein